MSKQILLTPFSINDFTLKNRAALAPMTRTSATDDGLATDEMARYYGSFAQGGFSLVITEGTYPDEQYSQGYINQPGIANHRQSEAWKKVVQAVHEQGSRIICQLMHAGPLVQGNRYRNQCIGPSAVQPKGEQLSIYGGEGRFSTPREMTREEIESVIRGFADAAKRAGDAGFDGVEIHGANGYLLDSFLTDYTNQRTDSYGGNTKNRTRLAKEVLREVVRTVGGEMMVGIRISQGKVNDFDHQWAGEEQDAEIIFGELSECRPDYVHTTEYDATEPAFGAGSSSLAGLAKKYGQAPVIANGHLEKPHKALEMLESGQADVVSLGKGALANHDWPKRLQHGEEFNEFNPNLIQPRANLKPAELTLA